MGLVVGKVANLRLNGKGEHIMNLTAMCRQLFAATFAIAALAATILTSGPVRAAVTPPDLGVCQGETPVCSISGGDCTVDSDCPLGEQCTTTVAACEAPKSVCTATGFKITLTTYVPSPITDNGEATYTYQICSPPAGICSADPLRLCLSNNDCAQHGAGTCDRECAADEFHDLGYADVLFPNLATGNCLAGTCVADSQISCHTDDDCSSVGGGCSVTSVTGTCACTEGSSTGCAVDASIVLGDSACFDSNCVGATGSCTSGNNPGAPCTRNSDCTGPGGTCNLTPDSGACQDGSTCTTNADCSPQNDPENFVARCNNTTLNTGDCIEMTVAIAGETNGLGTGATVLVDKASNSCTASCMAGPSCTACDETPTEGGECLTRTRGFWGTHPYIAAMFDPVEVCGHSIEGYDAGECSTSEALCTNAKDRKANPPFLELIAQLTAAKLNLNATAALFQGATCSDFTYNDETIQQIIARCEPSLCDGSKKAISESGCIEALDAFNNSEDGSLDVTPAPFNGPGPADVEQCQLARGNGKAIGYDLCL